MADKRFVSDKPMTFNCDLELDRGNLNFVHDTPYHFALLSVKFDKIPYIGF